MVTFIFVSLDKLIKNAIKIFENKLMTLKNSVIILIRIYNFIKSIFYAANNISSFPDYMRFNR